jgi:hypothetical protein
MADKFPFGFKRIKTRSFFGRRNTWSKWYSNVVDGGNRQRENSGIFIKDHAGRLVLTVASLNQHLVLNLGTQIV